MNTRFLFRALNSDEIRAGCVLIPKSKDSFLAEPRFPAMFPIVFGSSERNAVRDHQWDSRFNTRGVSTSTSLDVAKRYAHNNIIVKVCRDNLREFGIKEYVVKEILPESEISHPEDEEVILVQEENGSFPKDIIVEVMTL